MGNLLQPFILIVVMWERWFVKQTSVQSSCRRPAKACHLYSSPTPSWLHHYFNHCERALYAVVSHIHSGKRLWVYLQKKITQCWMFNVIVFSSDTWWTGGWNLLWSHRKPSLLCLLYSSCLSKWGLNPSVWYKLNTMHTVQVAPQCSVSIFISDCNTLLHTHWDFM